MYWFKNSKNFVYPIQILTRLIFFVVDSEQYMLMLFLTIICVLVIDHLLRVLHDCLQGFIPSS